MKPLLMFIAALISISKPASAQLSPYMDPQNWTSCEEFVNDTALDPDSVIDIDWKIFFFWNPEMEQSYNIKFSRPTKVLVDRFRVELEKTLKPPANWSDVELFMETSIEFSALYLKTSWPGIYRVIPSEAFHFESIPYLLFGMKLVKPYLGIANCKHRICYALAPADKMPFHYEIEKAARTLNFYNTFNRSHISLRPVAPPHGIPYAPELPDDDEDDDLEVERDLNRMELF